MILSTPQYWSRWPEIARTRQVAFNQSVRCGSSYSNQTWNRVEVDCWSIIAFPIGQWRHTSGSRRIMIVVLSELLWYAFRIVTPYYSNVFLIVVAWNQFATDLCHCTTTYRRVLHFERTTSIGILPAGLEGIGGTDSGRCGCTRLSSVWRPYTMDRCLRKRISTSAYIVCWFNP